jgi:outer membrane protein TolC
MMFLRLSLILLSILSFSSLAIGQVPVDSSRIFTLEELFGWVRQHHPVAQQAGLLSQQADAIERQARGGFDPKAYADWDQKSFDDKDYFAIGEGGFKVPTWYGIELKAAYEITDGIFLNPERNLPDAGQAILGITMPLARGLAIDQRRAALRQAQLMATVNEIEQRRILNNLLMETASAYWEWALAYSQIQVYERALEVVEQRFGGIVESFKQGDIPAIDTLETLIQVQNRQLDLNNAQLIFQNAGLMLSNFLWFDGHLPLELGDQLRPPLLTDINYDLLYASSTQLWQQAAATHPEIRKYEMKREQLEINRRLAAEQMKPQLDVSYNFLGDGASFINGGAPDDSRLNTLVTQNFKWGLDFEMPLFLRKERGKLEQTKLKIQDNEFVLEQKRVEVENKIGNYFNNLSFLLQQINIYNQAVGNYQALLEAELIKFEQGESSIFLINSREQKLIDAQLKLAELRAKFQKNKQSLEWAAGQLQ